MCTVALIGPDGAGKTTICQRLESGFPFRLKYLYMGINQDSSNRMLLTTRLLRMVKRACGATADTIGPRDSNAGAARPKNIVRRFALALKSGLSLTNRIADEWYRQFVAWYYEMRGWIVLFDRHYFSDYYAYDIDANGSPRPLGRRIHGMMLKRFYPKPDLVIYLDAPSEVLFARKGEGTLEILDRRRQEYMQVGRQLKHFVVVDANRPPIDVTADVADHILRFCQENQKTSNG